MVLLTNATHSKEIGMTIYARQPIAAGDTIYHSYAREFTTTTFRRLILCSGMILSTFVGHF